VPGPVAGPAPIPRGHTSTLPRVIGHALISAGRVARALIFVPVG
jgi:hypothetical protein